MSFWIENFNYKDYNNNNFDFMKNIKQDLNEFVERSFLEIFESLENENLIKDFSYRLSLKCRNGEYDSRYGESEFIKFSDENKVFIKNEKHDFTFNSKMKDLFFLFKQIALVITTLTKEDFLFELECSQQEFIDLCSNLTKKYENKKNPFYLGKAHSELFFIAFMEKLDISRINCFCNLVSKYGEDVCVFVEQKSLFNNEFGETFDSLHGKTKNEINIKTQKDIALECYDKIKDELSFKNLFLISKTIILDSHYINNHEFETKYKNNEFMKQYYYVNFNQAKSEFQKSQILKNLEITCQKEPLNQRRL